MVFSLVETMPLQVETNASDYAIAAILSQKDCHVVYVSLTLNSHQQKCHTVKKETCSIVEATHR